MSSFFHVEKLEPSKVRCANSYRRRNSKRHAWQTPLKKQKRSHKKGRPSNRTISKEKAKHLAAIIDPIKGFDRTIEEL